MLVYRYEKDGIGPFGYLMKSQYESDALCDVIQQWSGDAHPNYVYDCKLSGIDVDTLLCGVLSITELRHWFPNPAIMRKLGFAVMVYDVPPSAVYQGTYQVAVLRDMVKRIGVYHED
jgi:hypothetical protein